MWQSLFIPYLGLIPFVFLILFVKAAANKLCGGIISWQIANDIMNIYIFCWR